MGDVAKSKEDLLAEINAVFSEYRLPPWSEANLGNLAHGECEITDVEAVLPKAADRVEMQFRFNVPGGNSAVANVRFGGSLVYVIPLFTFSDNAHEGTRVCLCKRWRVELGRWTYQVPHALESHVLQHEVADALASPAHRILEKTFGAELPAAISAARVIPVGRFLVRGENTFAESYVLVASVLMPFRHKKGDGSPVFLSWPEVLTLLDEGQVISDVFSVAVLLKAARRFHDSHTLAE